MYPFHSGMGETEFLEYVCLAVSPSRYTVFMCVSTQCVSSHIKMKEGDGRNTEAKITLSYIIFDNDLLAKQGDVRWCEVSPFSVVCNEPYMTKILWWLGELQYILNEWQIRSAFVAEWAECGLHIVFRAAYFEIKAFVRPSLHGPIFCCPCLVSNEVACIWNVCECDTLIHVLLSSWV